MTSTPAAFFRRILRSSSANRYGGSRSSRSACELMQVPQEVVGQLSAVDGDGPSGQVHVEVLPHLDVELTAVEADGDRRVAAAQHVGDGGAAGAGAGRHRLADAALEDPCADDARLDLGVPADVRAVREQL